MRSARWFRIARAFAAGAAVLALVYGWDYSRQPTSGDGWRLLAFRRGLGEPNSVAVLADREGVAAAWAALRLDDPPEVDLGRYLVVWLVESGSFACRSRLDGISFDLSRRVVAGLFSQGPAIGCDSASVADSFVVALDRRRLPPVPWTLAWRDPPPVDAPGGVVVVRN